MKTVAPGPPAEDDDDDISLADDGLTDTSSEDESDSPGEEDGPANFSYSPTVMSKEDEAAHDRVHAGAHQSAASRTEADKPGASPERHTLSHQASSNYFDNRLSTGSSGEGNATPGTASGMATPGGTRRPFFLRRNKTSMTTGSVDSGLEKPEKEKKSKKGKSKKRKDDFNFDAESNRDVLGIVIMEIQSATDLPRLKSSQFRGLHHMWCQLTQQAYG